MKNESSNLTRRTQPNIMRSEHKPFCYLCCAPGVPMFTNLHDRLYGAAGLWNLSRCTDPACGLIWMSPMPVPEDIGLAYKTYYTHDAPSSNRSVINQIIKLGTERYIATKYGYDGDLHWRTLLASILVWLDPGWRANADFSVFYLPIQNQGKLLEVGCGNGVMLRDMQRRGWEVTGLDVDSRAVANARSQQIDVRVGSLSDSIFEESSFDVVTMSHVIEHLHDPLVHLGECFRILRPGGRLILVTPNTNSLSFQIFGRNWFHLDPPRHLHLFNARNLGKLVRTAGFVETSYQTVPRDAKGAYSASIMIRKRDRWQAGARFPLTVRFLGRFLELIEATLLQFKPDKGTELVLCAQKPWEK